MTDPTVALDETAPLAPVSLYASQKVEIERELLTGGTATCLRFATVYGLSPRMRFDLTVNEFTRDLWARRPLEVYGAQFWRPYVHVADAGRAIELVLTQPPERVAGHVFNIGESAENYRKADLVELITAHLGHGHVHYVERNEDPRDYRVNFDRARDAARLPTHPPRPRRHHRNRRRAPTRTLRRPLRARLLQPRARVSPRVGVSRRREPGTMKTRTWSSPTFV